MKKLAIISVFLFVNFALVSQNTKSINANFQDSEQGWKLNENIEGVVKWTSLFSPMEHRNGISFFGENHDENLFLFIEKEVDGLLPNRNYRVMFNMNWVYKMDPSASPVFVKIGSSKRDLIVAGQLTPSELGYPFLQNVHNFDSPFFVNTDENGRLFLMIGVETKDEKIEDIFLSALRILLSENGEAREIQTVHMFTNEEISEVVFDLIFEDIDEKNFENETIEIIFVPGPIVDVIFFEFEYKNDVEMVNIYTEDNHLMKIFTFRSPLSDRAFRTTGLTPGTYRIEFILNDGRIINQLYTVK